LASLSVNAMRKELIKMYPGYRWKQRVSSMSDGQVVAIYQRKIREESENADSKR